MSINIFFQKLKPKKKFIPILIKVAENIVDAASLLKELMKTKTWEERLLITNKIKEREHFGDSYTHQLYDMLHSSFITPFDREDIQLLITSLDEVIDYINSSAQRIYLYKPKTLPLDFEKLANIIYEGTLCMKLAVENLKDLKNFSKIKEQCVRINDLENIADDIYYLSISYLFETEKDAIELIKIKEILQTLEIVTDNIEDVADILKTIMIKNT
ncbi:MAG: DUF47 family protein [Bacteroidales bacterium]|nr:DUF47 family protein [Bacteroidales bacterium]